ncbi:hypothetical protein FKM82_017515 [Ascaphus truei]
MDSPSTPRNHADWRRCTKELRYPVNLSCSSHNTAEHSALLLPHSYSTIPKWNSQISRPTPISLRGRGEGTRATLNSQLK